ncbi:MAG: hypothetical protein PHO67_08250 [Candidatus Omnitrophica bacterium]|nr:hypothetical protein [Candidatus Omnitrophota bacterium]
MTKAESQELAMMLTILGDAMGCQNKKVYSLASTRMAEAAKRIRKMLGVLGEDEKA